MFPLRRRCTWCRISFLALIFDVGIQTGIFPLLIFMGVAWGMTDFGPLIANPKTALLGAAAQFGIFATVLGAIWLSKNVEAINYSIQDAGAIGIIGGADGPTAIFLAGKLSLACLELLPWQLIPTWRWCP